MKGGVGDDDSDEEEETYIPCRLLRLLCSDSVGRETAKRRSYQRVCRGWANALPAQRDELDTITDQLEIAGRHIRPQHSPHLFDPTRHFPPHPLVVRLSTLNDLCLLLGDLLNPRCVVRWL